MKTLAELNVIISSYKPDSNYHDEPLALRCCELAIEALDRGCYGVGAILYDKGRNILSEAGNEVFADGFNSGKHAEMIVIDLFEATIPEYGNRSDLTLMTSLEPCPMCLTRSLIAGIGKIVFLADDIDGGMVQRIDSMPPAWLNLAELQERSKAMISNELGALASQLAACYLKEPRHRLMENIRHGSSR